MKIIVSYSPLMINEKQMPWEGAVEKLLFILIYFFILIKDEE